MESRNLRHKMEESNYLSFLLLCFPKKKKKISFKQQILTASPVEHRWDWVTAYGSGTLTAAIKEGVNEDCSHLKDLPGEDPLTSSCTWPSPGLRSSLASDQRHEGFFFLPHEALHQFLMTQQLISPRASALSGRVRKGKRAFKIEATFLRVN